MEEKEFNIGKNIKINMMTDYKEYEQMIVGVTTNKETEKFASSSLYEDVAFKKNKYEFNIWLFYVSFHLTIYGRTKKCDE